MHRDTLPPALRVRSAARYCTMLARRSLCDAPRHARAIGRGRAMPGRRCGQQAWPGGHLRSGTLLPLQCRRLHVEASRHASAAHSTLDFTKSPADAELHEQVVADWTHNVAADTVRAIRPAAAVAECVPSLCAVGAHLFQT
jgi:hypothetical protein